ncbi:MAG TPA: response regulator [Burkholderiales bacterium]|nr:response regulator [Burkholderiales bacterium]
MNMLRKILVVDDDPVVGKSFDRVLAGKGYAVITATNGEEALEKLAHEEYDAVYADIRMPGMSGLEVAERVKARRPWLPVVIVTGYGTEAHEAKAKAVGVTEFLRKPLSPETIEDSARKAVTEKDLGVAADVAAEPAAVEPMTTETTVARSGIKAMMALAAPFIGLAFIIAVPFAGLAYLAWHGLKALVTHRAAIGRFVKNVALFFAAPFVGLAYAVAFPFVGLGVLVWMGAKAIATRPARN